MTERVCDRAGARKDRKAGRTGAVWGSLSVIGAGALMLAGTVSLGSAHAAPFVAQSTSVISAAVISQAVMTQPGMPGADARTRELLIRIEALEREVLALSGQAAAGQVQPGGAASAQPGGPRGLVPAPLGIAGSDEPSSAALARLLARVDQLESQLRRLTGELERMQFQYERLNTIVNQLAQETGGSGFAPARPSGPAQPGTFGQQPGQQQLGQPQPGQQQPGGFGVTPGVPNPGIPSEAGVPREAGVPPLAGEPSFPGAPGTASDGYGAADGVGPDGMTGAGPVAPGQAAVPAPTGDPRSDFNVARDLLLRGDFAAAEAAFRQYAETYPEDSSLGEVYYWIGESLMIRELYTEAAKAFLQSARDYPDNPKAPYSLLHLATSLQAQGQTGQACRALQQASEKYPDAPEPLKRRVRKARGDFRCG